MMFLIIIFSIFICFSSTWKIRSNETVIVEDLKTKCSLSCPFQCVKGCHLLTDALITDCESLCNITQEIKMENLYCYIGCKESLNGYFNFIADDSLYLKSLTLLEHTLSSTSLTLEWDEENFSNETHLIQCRNVDLSESWQLCQNQTWTSFHTVSIIGLNPFTKYQFRVSIQLTPYGEFEVFSEQSSIIATLPGGQPSSSPVILAATAVDYSTISITWKASPDLSGPVTSYILQINELPHGYAAVKDIAVTDVIHSYMFQNLKQTSNYSLSVSAKNSKGLGPPATVVISTSSEREEMSDEPLNIIIATSHTVYSMTSSNESPIVMYNTTHTIKGIAVHVHRELLFICDSSGSILVTSSKGMLTPETVLTTTSAKPLLLTVDWMNDHLYIISEVLHPSGSIVYQVARCSLDGSNLIVVMSGFIMKPHHIEVDPYNGYLFWVVRGVGLYRLDLIDINKTVNYNVSPELIIEDINLGAFFVDYNKFRIVLPVHSQNTVVASSLNGREITDLRDKMLEPYFHNVVCMTMVNGLLYWTDGSNIYQESYNSTDNSYQYNITDDKSFSEEYICLLANIISSQSIPIPVNPPSDVHVIFGYDIAKIFWEPPYRIAGQGEGAWCGWLYTLILEDNTSKELFQYDDIKTNHFTVTALKLGTKYNLKVTAYTSSGQGPFSKTLTGTTVHRNISLIWSNGHELIISDLTGYRLMKIEPSNFIENDKELIISDVDWFDYDIYIMTESRHMYQYNLLSSTYTQVQDIISADSFSIDWIGYKIYYSDKRRNLIFRCNLNGSKHEILNVIIKAESLVIDSKNAFLYLSTLHTIESIRLDGMNRTLHYKVPDTHTHQVIALTLDIINGVVYWVVRNAVNTKYSLLSNNMTQSIQNSNVTEFNVSDHNLKRSLSYVDEHVIWISGNEGNAVMSSLTDKTSSVIQSDSLSNLKTCKIMDQFLRNLYREEMKIENINVIPSSVSKSSVHIEGVYNLFNVTWSPVIGVNYGQVFYRVRITENDLDTIVNTRDTYITVNNSKAYVQLKIVIQSWTYWAASEPVHVTLHSPSSTPSAPSKPRIFVIHKKSSLSSQKEIAVVLRWSPPKEPNGIIQRYELSCWVTRNSINQSATACSSIQISAKTLEFTLLNLHVNKTYYFQVRACTSVGCGFWSRTVDANLKNESPIPKLLITTNEGLVMFDYDRKIFDMPITGTSLANSATYDALQNEIYWIQDNLLYKSQLHLHIVNQKQVAVLGMKGYKLCFDWISRILYWLQIDGNTSLIGSLDLNRIGDESSLNVVLTRNNMEIQDLTVSPYHSCLYWIERKNEFSGAKLMRSGTDGKFVKTLFMDHSHNRNDLMSILTTNDEGEGCNCSSSWLVDNLISIYPKRNGDYNLLWVERESGNVMSADAEGCQCFLLLDKNKTNFGLPPKSITADFERLYWTGNNDYVLYSKSFSNSDEDDKAIEQVSASRSIHIEKLLSFGSHMQRLPSIDCLWPHSDVGIAKLVKHSSDSITLQLPLFKKDPICGNMSTPTIEYTVYYSIIQNDGTSNCTINLKSCAQAVTYDKIKKISKLKPYTRYAFMIGVSTYYSQLRNMDPILGPVAIYRTAPGAPSQVRNVTAISVSPKSIFVNWQPPAEINAESLSYEIHWRTKQADNVEMQAGRQNLSSFSRSYLITQLKPLHMYFIKVRAYAAKSNGSSDSKEISIWTYAEPNDIKVINVTSNSIKITPPENLFNISFELERYDSVNLKWKLIGKFLNTDYMMVNNLEPLTRYSFRLKIFYTNFQEPFIWPEDDGFVFSTLGDIPKTPGMPTGHYLQDTIEIDWNESINYGLEMVVYYLEGKKVDEYATTNDNQWILCYNGTNNFWKVNGLRLDWKYIFRVKGKNEYGFSEYSKESGFIDLSKSSLLKMIFLWLIAPASFIVGIISLTTVIYLKRKHRDNKKKFIEGKIRDVIEWRTRSSFELANIREMPSGAGFINDDNILYCPQITDQDLLLNTTTDVTSLTQVSRDQITLTKFLGSGAFGEVYEGIVKNFLYENCDTKVAIKALRKNATEQEKLEFLKEAKLMNKFKHKHILRMLGVCLDNNPHFIIMELMEAGDLLTYLRSNRSNYPSSSGLTLLDVLNISVDVAEGCCYLEDMHFVHRDLACRNCLVSSTDSLRRVVKIGDFGLARDIYKNDYYRKEGEGLLPVRWMAPESLVDGVFTTQSDVWSFGVLLWEVVSLGEQPYPARSNIEVLQYVRAQGRLGIPPNCPQEMYELMEKCWSFDSKDRPTFKYCLSALEKLKYAMSISSETVYTNILPAEKIYEKSVEEEKHKTNNETESYYEEILKKNLINVNCITSTEKCSFD